MMVWFPVSGRPIITDWAIRPIRGEETEKVGFRETELSDTMREELIH